MNLSDAKKVKNLLSNRQNIVIIPHKNPDGDAMGSCLGLFLFLKKEGHNVVVIAPNDYPKFLKWLPANDTVQIFDKDREQTSKTIIEADLVFTLDFNDFSRVGDMQFAFQKAKGDFIMIDHHQQPSDYAAVTYSDVAMSSTCEMVYRFIEALDGLMLIDEEIATCLYTGIMTDTGSFKYHSTSSDTHRIIANLIDKGVNNTEIHQNIFDTNSPSRLYLLGTALNNLQILNEFNAAYITLSQEELDQHQFKKGDTEGFVNQGLSLEGISLAAIFIENKDEGIIKISFRSIGDFSVNEFARAHFSGGGHTNAAGGRSELSLTETVEKFKTLLQEYKKELTV